MSSAGASLVIRRVCGSSVCQQPASLSTTRRRRGGQLGEELVARQPARAEDGDFVDQSVDRHRHHGPISLTGGRGKYPRARGMVGAASSASVCTYVTRSEAADSMTTSRGARTDRPWSRRGRAPLVLRRPDDDQGLRREDRRPCAVTEQLAPRGSRLAPARPPQRGRVVLRHRGRADVLGRWRRSSLRPDRSSTDRGTSRTRSSSAPSRPASCW